MSQQPITGDAGSPRRPRTMDKPRRAAWAAAFKKLNAGLKVWEMPAEEHAALLRPGLFEGLDEVAAQEEAACVVRYWLHEFDWSPIPPRGPTIAPNWPNIESEFDAQRAEEALLNYIQASTHDRDYREALDGVAVWHHEQRRPFPPPLAEWAIQLHRGKLKTLPKPRGDQGRPAYAQANRNVAMAATFHLLGYLGMHGKSVRHSAIGAVLECSEDAVRKALATDARSTGKLPAPWECWPPPRRKAQPHSGLGAARGRGSTPRRRHPCRKAQQRRRRGVVAQ